MIPAFIFNQQQLQQAITSCDNHISALAISNFTSFEKMQLESIYVDLHKIYSERLITLQSEENTIKSINTTYELVSNE